MLIPSLWAQAKYQMSGTIIDRQSQTPVAGAEIEFRVPGADNAGSDRFTTTTDELGRYQIELPPGHASLSALRAPRGYWTPDLRSQFSESFVLTDHRPQGTLNLHVSRGIEIPVSFIVSDQELEEADEPGLIRWYEAINRGSIHSIGSELNRATLTINEQGGVFAVYASKSMRRNRFVCRFEVDAGFDPEAIVGEPQDSMDGFFTVVDENGKQLKTLFGSARVDEGRLSLLLAQEEKKEARAMRELTLSGWIIGPMDERMPNVNLRLVSQIREGDTSRFEHQPLPFKTDQQGEFRLTVQFPADSTNLQLYLSHERYACRLIDIADLQQHHDDELDLAALKIASEGRIRVQVVDDRGEKVVGAVVDLSSPDLIDTLFDPWTRRTDEEGEVVLASIPEGVATISVRYGILTQSSRINVEPGQEQQLTVTMAPGSR